MARVITITTRPAKASSCFLPMACSHHMPLMFDAMFFCLFLTCTIPVAYHFIERRGSSLPTS
ncbi:hypothetical protein Hanom_Chr13g01199521 [Helianthus anomalus]